MLLKYFNNDSLEEFEKYKFKKYPVYLKDGEKNKKKYGNDVLINPNILSSLQCQINTYSNFLIDYELEIKNINILIEDED